MKERPILFSGEMVRAILELIKSMTRRTKGLKDINIDSDMWELLACTGPGQFVFKRKGTDTFRTFKCPYGQVGDRLWVKETFGIGSGIEPCKPMPGHKIYYRSTGAAKDGTLAQEEGIAKGWPVSKWRPSIFMPRWASRITLEIVSVRVERLQDITEEDAKAEGCTPARWFVPAGKPEGESRNLAAVGSVWNETWEALCYRNAYATLWEKINGAGSWDANPWVWVIEFKKVEVAK
jgi:hypothetical protein